MIKRLIIVLTSPAWFTICVALFIVELFAYSAIELACWIKTGAKSTKEGLWIAERFYHFIFPETTTEQ